MVFIIWFCQKIFREFIGADIFINLPERQALNLVLSVIIVQGNVGIILSVYSVFEVSNVKMFIYLGFKEFSPDFTS
jgi:hypothetical protein